MNYIYYSVTGRQPDRIMLFLFIVMALWLAGRGNPIHSADAIIYVNHAAGGDNNGLNWTDAYTDLQTALAHADPGDEIWVAQGVYKPAATIDPSISFDLPNGVALYGGFAGIETTLDQRDWRANLTILSGDIDNNDIAPSGVVTDTANIVGANSYHVVAGKGITNSTVLDGFTITAGQANGSFPEDSGAGFYCDGAGDGNECSPTLANITFVGNWAGLYAGAMFNNGTVGGNSSPNLTNIIFAGNTAGFGGAMFNDGAVDGNSSPTLINVVFSGNVASSNGGAMLNDGFRGGNSNPTLINVTFSGNTAASHGGAIVSYSTEGGSSNPVLTNVILWGNSASDSGDVMYNENAMPTIAYSLVEGGLDGSGIVNIGTSAVTDGGGNINSDPLFVTPVDINETPPTAGNLRLQPGSPAIDSGDNNAVPAGVTTDLDGRPRIMGVAVDMGAYEFLYELYLPVIQR